MDIPDLTYVPFPSALEVQPPKASTSPLFYAHREVKDGRGSTVVMHSLRHSKAFLARSYCHPTALRAHSRSSHKAPHMATTLVFTALFDLCTPQLV